MFHSNFQKQPAFPHYTSKNGIAGFFAFIFSLFVWAFLLLFFIVSLYTQWFIQNLVYLLQLIHPKNYFIPFWFALILVIFAFPLTFILILLATFIKIVR